MVTSAGGNSSNPSNKSSVLPPEIAEGRNFSRRAWGTDGQIWATAITKGSNKGSYDIISNPVCEPFTERFENYLAGWAITFDLAMPNTMTYC